MTISSDDQEVELGTDGGQRAVTFANKGEYCEMVQQYRLHEYDLQADAIRRGLGTIVPLGMLTVFSWTDLGNYHPTLPIYFSSLPVSQRFRLILPYNPSP